MDTSTLFNIAIGILIGLFIGNKSFRDGTVKLFKSLTSNKKPPEDKK